MILQYDGTEHSCSSVFSHGFFLQRNVVFIGCQPLKRYEREREREKREREKEKKYLSRLVFLIIKIYEYDVGAGDLADPLYRLPSEFTKIRGRRHSRKRRRIVKIRQKWYSPKFVDVTGRHF